MFTLIKEVGGRTVKVGGQTMHAHDGNVSLVLGERFAHHRISPGRYKLTVQAKGADGALSGLFSHLLVVKAE